MQIYPELFLLRYFKQYRSKILNLEYCLKSVHRIYWVRGWNYHRIDGPAIECLNGDFAWYIDGRFYDTQEEWFAALTPKQKDNYIWNVK